jgi:hypothetical protein
MTRVLVLNVLAGLTFATQAFATMFLFPRNADTLRTECVQSQIQSFLVTGFDRYTNERNYCIDDGSDLPLEFARIIQWAGEQSQRAERFFGFEMPDLLPSGLTIQLNGTDFAFNNTFRPGIVILGYFKSWNPVLEPMPWDDVTYLHELTHVVQLDPKSKTPKALRDLRKTTSVFESFPDFVPFAITGVRKIEYSRPELGGCFKYHRDAEPDFSFSRPFEAFSYYGNYRNLKCCGRLSETHRHTPRSIAACAATEDIWKRFFADKYPSVDVMQETFIPEKHCIDKDGKYSVYLCSDHEIGVAMNSFMFQLSDTVGIPPEELYLGAFADISTGRGQPSISRLFKALKKRVGEDQAHVFDAVWRANDMDTLMRVERLQGN